jgi:hypothetical protein
MSGIRKKSAYLLYHVREMNPDEEDSKLIGVYSSRRNAQEARLRSSKLPGFRKYPDGFVIDRYIVNEDGWTSGFATMKNKK